MKPGDVFMVRGNRKFSTLLATAQKAFYGKAKSSHVLVNLAEGSFVHATRDGGIDIVFFEEVLPEIEPSWRAIRLNGLNQAQREEIKKAAIFYFEQGYNYKYFSKENEHSSFCSELVAKIYRKAGISIFEGKDPSKTIPADFDRAFDSNDEWEEVTEEFKAAFDEMKKSISDYRMGFSIMVSGIKKRQFMLRKWSQVFKAMEAMVEQEVISKEFYEKAAEQEKVFLEQKNISFWDEE